MAAYMSDASTGKQISSLFPAGASHRGNLGYWT